MSGEELRAWIESRDASPWSSGFSEDFRRGYDTAVEEVRAALAAPSTPEPSGHPTDVFVAQAQRFIAEHEATHGEPEQCGGECIVLGLTDEAAPSTEPSPRHHEIGSKPDECRWCAEYARLAESQP